MSKMTQLGTNGGRNPPLQVLRRAMINSKGESLGKK